METVDSQSLQNKVVVVIGGTVGLGLSAAASCAEAGARVVVTGRNPDNVESAGKTLGDQGKAILADAMSPGSADKAVAAAAEMFGSLDGLYHVAGGSGRSQGDGPLDQISDEGWEHTLGLNLTSVFRSNRAATQQFLKQGTPGSILNMGSVLGFSPAAKYFASHAYATTKAAIIGLTQTSAAYYAQQQIRFNVVAPALVDTPMARRAAENDEIMEYIATKQPLDGGRIGRPADLDAAVVYFLSDASRFVTGQVLAIDGGWSVSEGQYPK